jgi:quercetin dioxygenase-like cupin family protein
MWRAVDDHSRCGKTSLTNTCFVHYGIFNTERVRRIKADAVERLLSTREHGGVLMTRFLINLLSALTLAQYLLPSLALAQAPLVVKSLAEKKVAELPAGPLFWRIESFATREQAQSAAGTWALVAESAGKTWLFTLGPAGGSSAGGTKVAEVGPIPRFDAPQYLLRINAATGAPGSTTPVHTHPGSETFFVLSGAQSIRTPDGVMVVNAGDVARGHGAGMPMQVSSSGSTDLHALVMFVLDATKPFSSPANFP